MNNQPKFKAWDTKTKRWIRHVALDKFSYVSAYLDESTEHISEQLSPNSRIRIVFAIGHEDKNSVEIYEGSVVDYPPAVEQGFEGLRKNVVEWSDFYTGFRLSRYSAAAYFYHECEVLGHIFEREDLQKELQYELS